jgi:hypothetical protein
VAWIAEGAICKSNTIRFPKWRIKPWEKPTTSVIIPMKSNHFLIIFPYPETQKPTSSDLYSNGHLPVIAGYKWDYTFYKWGCLSTYN